MARPQLPGVGGDRDEWGEILNRVLTDLQSVADVIDPAGDIPPEPEGDFAWSGYQWVYRQEGAGGPAYNGVWDSPNQVSVDGNGYLTISLRRVNDVPTSAEILTTRRGWGYGTYRWVIGSNVSGLHKNVVLGLFTYDGSAPSSHNEIDIQASAFGYGSPSWWHTYWRPGIVADGEPEKTSVVTDAFRVPTDPLTTHEFEWGPQSITWRYWVGDDTSGPPDRQTTIVDGESYDYINPTDEMTYSGVHVVPVPNNEPVMINLWARASNATDADVVIRSFEYTPYDHMAYTLNRANHFGKIDVANITGLPDQNPAVTARKEVSGFYDFLNGLEGTPFTGTATGDAAIQNLNVTDNQTVGVVLARTGPGGTAGFMTHPGSIRVGLNRLRVTFRQSLSVVPTTASDYTVRTGFINNVAAPTNGIFFESSRAVSANWQGTAINNGVVTRVNTGIPIDVDFHTFRIEVTTAFYGDGATTARFFIDDVDVGSTTAVPAWSTVGFGIGVVKGVGSGTPQARLDYMAYDMTFFGER